MLRMVLIVLIGGFILNCADIDRSQTIRVSGRVCDRDSKKPVTGNVLEYYDEGTIKSKEFYWKGIRHGMSYHYFPSQQLSMKGKYKDGLKDGEWRYQHENGSLMKIEVYLDGELQPD